MLTGRHFITYHVLSGCLCLTNKQQSYSFGLAKKPPHRQGSASEFGDSLLIIKVEVPERVSLSSLLSHPAEGGVLGSSILTLIPYFASFLTNSF